MDGTPDARDEAENGDTAEEFERKIRARFFALESEVRRLRKRANAMKAGLALAILLAAASWVVPGLLDSGALGFGGSGGDEGVVEARRIVLLGEDGQPRGEWSVDEEGNASLVMLDVQQRERLELSVRTQGDPGLSLSNAVGQRRVALGLLADETTSLVFADAAGVPRAVLGLVRGDAANLLLADAQGVSRIGFGLDGRGVGSVILPEDSESTEGGPGS